MKADVKDIWENYFLGRKILQQWQDLMLYEMFFGLHKPKTIIEIGTFSGGMSTFLAAQALQVGAKFYTYDHVQFANFTDPLSVALGMDKAQTLLDVFSEGGIATIRGVIENPGNKPIFLFCDGGNKPREFQTFGNMLSPGDFLAVHDYGTEFGDPDGDPVSKEMILKSECESVASMTRFYRKL